MNKTVIKFGSGQSIEIETEMGGGSVVSTGLREACPDCGDPDCNLDCEPQATRNEDVTDLDRLMYNASIDAMEFVLMALAGAGVDLKGKKVRDALQGVLDNFGNRFGN